ncbi:hypothetical protein AMJ49_06200 [Parcubacteria bacterium DG_74_2]|nr:MAG: hypothetical protein AMJ49_06200 [Parcubacteria bacterium DG_74_2]
MFEHKLLAKLWLLGLMDTILTKIGLDKGGIELNPLFYFMPNNFLLFKYVVVSFVVLIMIRKDIKKKELRALKAVFCFYLIACFSGFFQLIIGLYYKGV